MKKKLIIFCIAVGLSLVLATPSFAVPTLITLDAESLGLGTYTSPEIISTQFGNVEFVGQIYETTGDADFHDPLKGNASGHLFDVGDFTAQTASLTFKFFGPGIKVTDIEFAYGGGPNTIVIQGKT